MKRNQVRTTMNRELGRFLYSVRAQSRQSADQVAASLGISEARFVEMEKRPSEIPCRELYRLFQHYGPEKMHQAQLVMLDAQASLFAKDPGPLVGSIAFDSEDIPDLEI